MPTRSESQRPPFPTGPIKVEFRPTHGPFRTITVTPAQWRGEACIVGATCSSSGQLEDVGRLYNLAAAPGTIEYSQGASAHMACLWPENRRVLPAHSRCQPTGAGASR